MYIHIYIYIYIYIYLRAKECFTRFTRFIRFTRLDAQDTINPSFSHQQPLEINASP